MHQPATAAMTGLSVLIPTVGTQRHNSGRSVTSAPDENARPPSPVRIATRCAERSNAANACCNSIATALLIALSFSGRLIEITETAPRCSMVTTDIDCLQRCRQRLSLRAQRSNLGHSYNNSWESWVCSKSGVLQTDG